MAKSKQDKARQRVNLTQADIRELQDIVESAALAREALQTLRNEHTREG